MLFPILQIVQCSASTVNKTEYVDPLGHLGKTLLQMILGSRPDQI